MRFYQDLEEIEVTLKNIETKHDVIRNKLIDSESEKTNNSVIKIILQTIEEQHRTIRETLARMRALYASSLVKEDYQTKIEDLKQ